MKRLHRVLAFCICGAMLLTSCSSKGKIGTDDAARLEELGNQFLDQIISELVPIRESTEELRKQEAVVSTEDKTYNIRYLYDFYEAYEAGEAAEMLTIFKTKSFVVTKVIFEGDKGYYFRYEYNKLDEKDITITSQMLDEVELKEDETLKKIEFTLKKEKKTPLVFTYKNIATEDSQ